MAVRKKGSKSPLGLLVQRNRTLWYHDESESYTVTFSEREARLCAEQGCVEVTGDKIHEHNAILGKVQSITTKGLANDR